MAALSMRGRIAALLLFAATSSAPAAVNLRPDGYVTDAAGVMDARTEQSIERAAADLDRRTGNQIAIVTVKSLDGEPVESVATRLFKEWGVGHAKQDDGVLFLLAVDDRKARIEVGYGLEPILPDARTGRILDDAIPYFREGDANGGVARVAATLLSLLDRTTAAPRPPVVGVRPSNERVAATAPATAEQTQVVPQEQQAPPQERRGSSLLGFLLFVLLLIVFFRHPWLLLLFLSGGRGRGGSGGGWGGGGFGGFGGFGGGSSGGGGASRGW